MASCLFTMHILSTFGYSQYFFDLYYFLHFTCYSNHTLCHGCDLDRVSGCIFQVHTWEPSIQNPYRGHVVWAVPENIDITVTLFRDPRQADFEDKEWTFHIEDVSTSVLIIYQGSQVSRLEMSEIKRKI